MALEKRNTEAALEAEKERISELEAAFSALKKERDAFSISAPPTEDISMTDELTRQDLPTDPAVYVAEIENLKKRMSEMVILIVNRFIIAIHFLIEGMNAILFRCLTMINWRN